MNPSHNPFFQLPHGAAYPPPTFALPPSNVPVPSALALAVQTPLAWPENAQRHIAGRPARHGGQWQAALPTPPPSISPPETHSIAAPHYATPVGRAHPPSVGLGYAPSVSGSAPGAGLDARHRTSGPRAGPSGPRPIQHPASTTEGPLPQGYPATQFGPYAGVVPHVSNGSRPIPQISLGHAVPAGMQEAADGGRPMKRKNRTDDEGDDHDEDEEDEEEEDEDEAALRDRRLKAKQKGRLLAVGEDGYRISPQTPEDGKIKYKTYAEEITKDLTTAVYCCSRGGDLRHRKTDKHRLAWGEKKGIFVPLIRMYCCHADGCKKWLHRADELVRHHDKCEIYQRQMLAETQAAAQAEANTGSTPAVVAGDLIPSGSLTLPSPTLPVMITLDVARQDPIDEPSSTPEIIIQQQLQEPPTGSPPTSMLASNFLDMAPFTAEEVDLFTQLFSMTEGTASSSSSTAAPSATASSNIIEEQLYDGFSFSSASAGQQGGLQGELFADFDLVTSFPPDIPDKHPCPQDPWSFFDHAFD